jgi:glycosyltransferase involved in cell wall biosynthesis
MGAPTVSVVIPAYQAAPFLEEALDSVRGQTRPVDDVVVVDDGSTDGTLALAERLAAAWPALRVRSQPNSGQSAARNAGIALAGGELVTFLDADDRMVPERIAVQVAYLEAHPEVDIVLGQRRDELEPGAVPMPTEASLDPRRRRDYITSMMVRREVLARAGGFDTGLRIAEEQEWLSRALARGARLGVVEHVLVRRRLHGRNLTQEVAPEVMDATIFAALRARLRERRGVA